MPLRHSPLILRCDVCETVTRHMCKRCGRPLCKQHRPERGRRCDACEADYERRARNLPERVAPNAMERAGRTSSVLFMPLAVSAATGLAGLLLFIVATVIGVTESWLGSLAMALFVLGAVLSIVLIPAMMLVGAGGNVGLGLAESARASLAHRSARKKFLGERKVALLPEHTDGSVEPDAEEPE